MNSKQSSSSTDVIVIGAGSGGLTVAVGLATFKKKVRLIERKHVGGDCTNVGCIPSKSLLHSTAHINDRSGTEILKHVRHTRDHLRDEETEHFGNTENITLQFGAAKIVAPGKVEITAEDGTVETVTADDIVIATGSRARRLPVEGLPEERYITNEELFEQTDVPKNLVIVGAGPIGLEMATAFRRLGTEVTVLEAAPQILGQMLPEAAAVVSASLTEKGITLKPGIVAKSFDEATQTLHIGPLDGDATDKIVGVDKLLMAAGRIPNCDGIGLDDVGVKMNKRGLIEVDGKGKTNVNGIWAVGDVTTEGGTTHIANAWGRRVVKAMVFKALPAGDKPLRPGVVFCDPEAASIGTQPVKVPGDVRRMTYDFSKADRSFTDEAKHGIIIVDAKKFSGEITGATVVGPRAGELISTFSLAMTAGVKLQKWYPTVWPYPTYSVALGAIADQFYAQHLPNLHKDFPRWLLGKFRRG